MNGPSIGEMVLFGLGALALNLFVGVLIWTLLFASGAVGAAAQEIDRAVRDGRHAEEVEHDDGPRS